VSAAIRLRAADDRSAATISHSMHVSPSLSCYANGITDIRGVRSEASAGSLLEQVEAPEIRAYLGQASTAAAGLAAPMAS